MGEAKASGMLWGATFCVAFFLPNVASTQDARLFSQWRECVQAMAGASAFGKDSAPVIASAALEACSAERTRYGNSFPPRKNFDDAMQANEHMRWAANSLLKQAQETVASVRAARK